MASCQQWYDTNCVFSHSAGVDQPRETSIRARGFCQRARKRTWVAKSLYVGGLPYSATQESVRELFEGVGEVSTVRLIMDRETGQSKGFAFVDMADDAAAQEAIAQLNGSQFGGRSLVVNEARPREERTGGGGGGGYRGGGGGGGGGGYRGGGGGGGYGGGGGGYGRDDRGGGGRRDY
jgi:RNA recognition motif. (a.k.a. RRM, RBD, or RNP domain)